MKTSLAILVLLAALSAAGQEDSPAVKPDYSKENLQRFVARIPDPPKHPRNFWWYMGGVEFRALGTNFRVSPLFLPLSGSVMRGITQEWPDPFALTNTTIATPQRAWRTQRQMNAELKRIEKTERARIRAKMH